MQTIKITQPLYIGTMAFLIQGYYKAIAINKGVKGLSYETLYTYFAKVVQHGGDMAEVWVAIDGENQPVAFAQWRVLGVPHYGVVHLEHLYNSRGTKASMEGLGKEFIEFGVRHNAPYYSFMSVNAKVANHTVKIAKKHGLNFENTGMAIFMGRKS